MQRKPDTVTRLDAAENARECTDLRQLYHGARTLLLCLPRDFRLSLKVSERDPVGARPPETGKKLRDSNTARGCRRSFEGTRARVQR